MFKDGGKLKPKDAAALEQFKWRLKDIVEMDPKKLGSDFYLFQWLREHGMKLDQAEMTIRNSFRWRKENKITETSENFPWDFLTQFPLYDDAVAKSGIRVFQMPAAEWDIKEALDRGDEEKLRLYSYLRTLKGENEWLEFNERALELRGVEVMYNPQVIHYIINAKNTRVNRLLHPSVIQSVFGTMTCIKSYFPGIAIQLIFINFTRFYFILFKIIEPLLTFASSIQLYDNNETRWKEQILKFIDPNQLLPEFGGTKLHIPK